MGQLKFFNANIIHLKHKDNLLLRQLNLFLCFIWFTIFPYLLESMLNDECSWDITSNLKPPNQRAFTSQKWSQIYIFFQIHPTSEKPSFFCKICRTIMQSRVSFYLSVFCFLPSHSVLFLIIFSVLSLADIYVLSFFHLLLCTLHSLSTYLY